MGFFSRMKNGWNLGMTSLETIWDNPQLIVFPILSGTTLLVVCASFFGGFAWLFGAELDQISDDTFGQIAGFVALFFFYLVTYFIIVFFNVGLVFSARRVFEGESVSFRDGYEFAMSRIGGIFNWALLAATVGMLLNTLRERLGSVGQIVSGLAGLAWSVATFFVVPVLAFEDLTPWEAVKRSAGMMRQKYGEAIGANFGFGVLYFIGYMVIILAAVVTGVAAHPLAGVLTFVVLAVLLHAALSAAHMVFIAATYQHYNDKPKGRFNGEALDSIFISKN